MYFITEAIRKQAHLTQEEFAAALGVSFATVNRWENGKSEPNPLAEACLYEFCLKQNIDVLSMTLGRIESSVAELGLESDRTILYHGSKRGIEGPLAPISREQCDFGKGFYMGSSPLQPLCLISSFDHPRFYVVSVPLKQLSSLKMEPTIDWAFIVALHRGQMEEIKETPLYRKYEILIRDKDLIVGPIADDRMFYALDNFFQGNITDEALLQSLSALDLGIQYVAKTVAACKAITIEKEIPVSLLERKFILDYAESNRVRGIALANEICRDFRRDGKFFDELLEEEKSK